MAKNLKIIVKEKQSDDGDKPKTINLSLPIGWLIGLLKVSTGIVKLFKNEIKTEKYTIDIKNVGECVYLLNAIKDEEPFVFVEVDDDGDYVLIKTEN